jgi:hypothetical protein
MKTKIAVLLIGVSLAGTQAFGAFTSAELLTASQQAVAAFEAQNPDHAAHFTGFKTWKSGGDAKVKIYVDHDGHAMEFDFLCRKQDNELECQDQ